MSRMAEAPSLVEASVEEIMKSMLRTNGLSIIIISIKNLLAFFVGASSVFTSIKNFCLYTGKIKTIWFKNWIYFSMIQWHCIFFLFSQVSPSFFATWINFFILALSICLNKNAQIKKRQYCLCCLTLEERDTTNKNRSTCIKNVCKTVTIPKSRDDLESFFENILKILLSAYYHKHGAKFL